jgi:ribonuclease T2
VYLLALTWAPNFCRVHPEKEECQQLAGSFAGNHLTLHGLWPQYDDAEAKQARCIYPAYCGDSCACQRRGASGACKLDPSLIPEEMSRYGPGFVHDNNFLANHEWPKHGSCTGLDARTYFSETIRSLLLLPGEEGTPAALSANVGGKVAVSELRSAFGAPESVLLGCDTRCNLAEVGICFGVDASGKPTTPIACPQNAANGSINDCVGSGHAPRCPTVSIQAASPSQQPDPPPEAACNRPGQGPACSGDDTCVEQGYLRCARSGCCTTIPKR